MWTAHGPAYHLNHDGANCPPSLQHDKIENGGPDCQTIPGVARTRHRALLIDTLTPLAVEAALTVAADSNTAPTKPTNSASAASNEARYHAELARRRYLAVDPANRLVADTLEADWKQRPPRHRDAQD